MKTLSTILVAFVLFAICVGECVAQSKSSATQTVTFGVRRIAAPLLAGNFSQVKPVVEPEPLSEAPLKVTFGSGVGSDEYTLASRTPVAKEMSQLIAARQSLSSLRSTSPKSVITVTE